MERRNFTESELVELMRKQHSSAMKSVYFQYVGYLSAVCSRYISNEENTRDVLQETFVKVFNSFAKFEYKGEGSLKAWISKIAVNESLKFLKRDKWDEIIQCENDLPDVIDDEDPDTEDIPADVIQEMICNLPVGYRTVFNLYVFEDKSHKEIASILGIKESSSASQLHHAKDMLVKKINDYKSGKYERAMER